VVILSYWSSKGKRLDDGNLCRRLQDDTLAARKLMGLWFRKLEDNDYATIDLVAEFIDIWLQTRRPEDIDPGELAGVIDVIYDIEPVPGQWTLIAVRPDELKRYIRTYIRSDGTTGDMMRPRDVSLAKEYVKLLRRGHEPPPIIIAGAEDPDTKTEGITLIDGRHRIHAAAMAGLKELPAYIPKDAIPMMEKAELEP
jgi:hypothetical protein